MRISRIIVNKLYSAYSYDISIPLDEGSFIITGPNGYGKSTVLRMIQRLADGDLLFFYLLDFETIVFHYDNNHKMLITKEQVVNEESIEEDANIEYRTKTVFQYQDNVGALVSKYWIDQDYLEEEYKNYRLKRTPKPYGDDPVRRRVRSINDRYEDMVRNNPEIYERLAERIGQQQFFMILRQIDCKYIPAERLYKPENDSLTSIEGIIESFHFVYKKEYRHYLEESQQLDRQMIDNLLNEEVWEYSEEEYTKRANVLKRRVGDLEEIGFDTGIDIKPYNKKQSRILSEYLNTVEKKVEACSDFCKKTIAFRKCLERKQFPHKTTRISKTTGIEFLSVDTGVRIPPTKLSSGEQNEIFMLYRLIFTVKDKSILLIDEPENSLHVEWQYEFVDDIEEIARAKDVQVIIATHAPAIVNNRWDKAYDLFGNNSDGGYSIQ